MTEYIVNWSDSDFELCYTKEEAERLIVSLISEGTGIVLYEVKVVTDTMRVIIEE